MDVNWTLNKMLIGTNTIRVYVNKSNTEAIVFPPFGRYFRLNSEDVLCFASEFFEPTRRSGDFETDDMEDTTSIYMDEAA